MEVLYMSTMCSDETFKKIYDASTVKPQQQAQKYHSLLSAGLSVFTNRVYHISRVPLITFDNDEELKKYSKEENYYYIMSRDKKIKMPAYIFFKAIKEATRWASETRGQDRVIVVDVLSVSVSYAGLIVSKMFRIKNIAIVTDLPEFMGAGKSNTGLIKRTKYKLQLLISNTLMKAFNKYVLISEQMNSLVNPKNRPHTIIEGLVDKKMINIENRLESKHKEKIVLYAGGLYESEGINLLIDAFMGIEDADIRLHLYGYGDQVEYIIEKEKKDPRIVYKGVVHNSIVVEEQEKATLLVNPRPSGSEFTKYSFPSKNMEYMVSGTPVLTTRLQNMPEEYNDYIYFFDDESVEGMRDKLKNVLGEDRESLHKFGLATKTFVLENKNNLIQAKKIIEMLEKLK